jgi:hypothetical protein
MALTTTEEAQTRALIAQNAALLSLASNEAAIISELGAGDVTLADLPVASSLSDSDLFLVRQGTTEKSVAKSLIATPVPDATESVKGIVELATVAEAQTGTDTVRAVTPAGLAASIVQASIQGAFKNLQASANGTTSAVLVSADSIVVKNSANKYTNLYNVSLASLVTGAASGAANSLDTGAWAFSTWYYIHVIWNGTTADGLFSLSATAPTLPSGYTYSARIGAIRTQSATNYNALAFKQFGRRVQYVVGASGNVLAMPQMGTGSAARWTAIGVGPFVSPKASTIFGTSHNTGSQRTLLAPNSNYAGETSTTNPPMSDNNSGAADIGTQFQMVLESSNIYWYSTGAQIYCSGWEDNL